MDPMPTIKDMSKDQQQFIESIILRIKSGSYTMDDIIIQEVQKEHPTHQQAFIGNLGRMILIYAERINFFDDRNKNAVLFAKAVAKMIEDHPDLMPFI